MPAPSIPFPVVFTSPYAAEARAIFARFTTPPTTARKAIINTLVVSLIQTGVWSKLDALYLMAAADSQAARQNWVQDAYNLTPVSGPTFTADRGYQGDGAASYLTTGYVPSSVSGKYALNDASIGVWARVAADGNYADISASNGSTQCAELRPYRSGFIYTDLNSNTAAPDLTAVSGGTGLTVACRSNATHIDLYKNGAALANKTLASTGEPPQQFMFLSRQGTALFSPHQLSAGFFGSALSAGENTALYNALNTYLQAVGAV